jgi:hypothetical protein
MCFRSQFIHHHHDGIMLFRFYGKLSNKIHCNNFPLPLLEWEIVVIAMLDSYVQSSPHDILDIWLCH